MIAGIPHISPDPYLGSMELGDPQSFNRYGYVGNDPINFIDPSGLMRVCWFTSWTECRDVTIVDNGELSTGNSSGGCSLATGWMCIDIGGSGGWNPVVVMNLKYLNVMSYEAQLSKNCFGRLRFPSRAVSHKSCVSYSQGGFRRC